MKRFVTVVAAFCAVGILSATEFNWKKLMDLYTARDFTAVETTAAAMKSSAKTTMNKSAIVYYTVMAKQNLGKYASKEAALADVDALAKELGIDVNYDRIRSLKLSVLDTRGDREYAIENSKDWTGPRSLYRKARILHDLKRYDESAEAFMNSGVRGSKVHAVTMARMAKMPEKIFEYGYRALAEENINDPAIALNIVNVILDSNFTGTTVTPAKVKDFLQMVNRKYSRKLVVNAPTKWDNLIQLVRQTLETY